MLISEYWRAPYSRAVRPPPNGLGFNVSYADGLRDAASAVLAAASAGEHAEVHIEHLVRGLHRPWGFPHAWQAYNHVENHDLVLDMRGDLRKPRIPKLADRDHPRSWYARNRARVAMGLLLTAPGIPMLFMEQEFLEDKLWSDNPNRADRMIWWDGLDGADRHMADFHAFTREMAWLRRRHPALRDEPIVVYPVDDRVLAFHRWVPGVGRDVVVLSLHEHTFYNRSYAIGFPQPGKWLEAANSDNSERRPNRDVQGNFGSITADGPPMHGMPCSAGITLPANSILVFTRDHGD